MAELCRNPAYIVDRYNKIYLMDHSGVIQKKDLFGKYISLVPFTREVTGVCLRGFRYGLEDRTLACGESIGVSNEMREGSGSAASSNCFIEITLMLIPPFGFSASAYFQTHHPVQRISLRLRLSVAACIM